MELKDTITGMTSPDYKERFKAEYKQIKIRHDKLEDMLIKHDKGELDFVPTCPIDVLKDQLSIMESYLGVLLARAHHEGINLYD